MKELEKTNQDKVEIGQEQKKESKKVLINRIQPHENHICFQYNTKTNEMSRAVFKKQDVTIYDSDNGIVTSPLKREVIVNSDCVYTTSLNEQNAIKHFSKILDKVVNPIILK